MSGSLRGRPRLDIMFEDIIDAVQRHGQVVAAARELGCSDAYIHQRFKENGLPLRRVLEEPPGALSPGSLCPRCGRQV